MKYHSPQEVAEIVGCAENAVWVALRSGELPHARIGKATVIEESDIAPWIAAMKDKTKDKPKPEATNVKDTDTH